MSKSNIAGQKCPAYSGGRWYTAFLESDGIDYQITVNDPLPAGDMSLSGTAIWLGDETDPYLITDFKWKVHASGLATDDYMPSLQVGSNGVEGVSLPAANVFDWMYIYIYAIKE